MKRSISTEISLIPVRLWVGSRPTNARGFLVAAIVTLLTAAKISAGVLVAPTVVVLGDKQRTGRMTVQNPTDKPKEITVHFSFGLPTSDSLGNVTVSLQDTAVTDPQSALGWIKAFPRKLVIPPNGSQIVRFVARPPKDLPDGEYWARVVVRSQEGETSIPSPSDDGAITTRLNMIMQTAIMFKYRKGDLTPQINVASIETFVEEDQIEALIDMRNPSKCSYVGVLKCRLLDAQDREISQNTLQLAVYRQLSRRVVLPLVAGDFAKPYRIDLSISTEGRSDIPAEDLLPGNEISRTLALR
jgi:P pilus assembly chaperone PapD